jgi:hypothetical protein
MDRRPGYSLLDARLYRAALAPLNGCQLPAPRHLQFLGTARPGTAACSGEEQGCPGGRIRLYIGKRRYSRTCRDWPTRQWPCF